MSKGKIIFCLVLLILSFIYLKDKINNINLFELLINDNKTSTIITNTINSKLSLNDGNKNYLNQKTKNKDPIIYLYNTHQTEEYAENAYNITPTVVTVNNILKDELKEHNLYSYIETNSVTKDLKKIGKDYTYTYTITYNYLKKRNKQYPSLKYYFDIHRDAIKGEYSRVTINNKKYAKVMFLIGKTNPDYKENVNNANIMINYLNKHYPNLTREIYYQKTCSFYQYYSPNMFLIEVGGTDNTLEELYNTSIALSNAISYYIKGGSDEK